MNQERAIYFIEFEGKASSFLVSLVFVAPDRVIYNDDVTEYTK